MTRSLREQIRARRVKRPLRGKGYRPRFPKAIELAYFALIRGVLKDVRARVTATVLPLLPELVDRAAERRGDSTRGVFSSDGTFLYGNIVLDAMDPGKRLNRLFDRLSESIYRAWDPNQLTKIAQKIGGRISEYQKGELSKQIKAAVGVDPVFANAGLAQRMKDFTAENVALIEKLPQVYLDRVEARILRGIGAGERSTEIAKSLAAEFDVTESNAKLIARDQTAKFYGSLNAARQQGLGVTKYVWRTMNEERVRPMHADLEGTVQSWDDPPVTNEKGETNHPGGDIQCRCFADPILDDAFADLEE
jgi:SPP1 gp7 family putative phage head morphogenesis protein